MIKEKMGIYLITFVSGVTLMAGTFGMIATYADDDVLDGEEIVEVVPPLIQDDVKVSYSITEATKESVVATFESSNPDIVVTNNDESNTYVFDDNDEFIFEYLNKSTLETGTILAKVDWIDKVVPTATVKFDYPSLTNKSVKATLIPSEEVMVLNNDYEVEDSFGNLIAGDPFDYTFDENGEFTFEFEDIVGNKGSYTVNVDWIDRIVPKATISYDVMTSTSSPVTAIIAFDKENVIVTNNDNRNSYVFEENGEFEFTFQDLAGNASSAIASVNWIDKLDSNENVNNTVNNNTENVKPDESENNNEIKEIPVTVGVASQDKEKDNSNGLNNKNNKSENIETVYKKLTVDNIEFEIDNSLVSDNITLKKRALIMNATLLERFNSNCDYFELFFEDENGSKSDIDVKNNSVLTVLLDGTKKFVKIYSVTADDKVQIVEYSQVDENKIEIKSGHVGKYIVEYEEVVSNSNQLYYDEEDDIESDDTSLNACIVICSCVIAAVFLTAIICLFIKEY